MKEGEQGGSTGLGVAYRDALKRKFSDAVAAFDYADDFDKFWSEEEVDGNGAKPAANIVEEANKSSKKALIITWDGMPTDGQPSDKLLEKHLTPLDWVLAFTMRMLKNEVSSHANFSIHIIDFTCQDYADTHAMRVRGSLLDEMPWVTLYAPLVPPDARFRKRYSPLAELVLNGDDQALPAEATTMAGALGGHENEAKEALQHIANLWRATVLQSSDHHDLNNIVGPQIISRMLSSVGEMVEVDSANMKAFLRRLEWTGLLPSRGLGNAYDAPVLDQPVNIVVIDDQLAMGWDRVLGALAGIPSTGLVARADEDLKLLYSSELVNLYGATKPYCLHDSLGLKRNGEDSVVVDRSLYKQRTFDSPIKSNGESRPWILVLDLRLFSGQVSREREWCASLACAAIDIQKSTRGRLAWKGFEEAGQLRYLAEGGAIDDAHMDTALSLLPRICALRWPSVPIILFSASRRRGPVARLVGYKNIFMASTKPNVLAGHPVDEVVTFTDRWRRELRLTRGLVTVQKSMISLAKTDEEILSTQESHGSGSKTGREQHTHIVIGFDESGLFDPGGASAVGGVIALVRACDQEQAIQEFSKFESSCRDQGLMFYEFGPISWAKTNSKQIGVSGTILKKGAAVSNRLIEAVKNVDGFKIGVFRVSISMPKKKKKGWSDNEYLLALRACIELLLCELPGSIGLQWGKTCSLALWLPSRQRFLKNPNDAVMQSRRYDFRWEGKRRNFVESVGGYGAAYAVVACAIGARSNFDSVMESIVAMKMRTIPYSKDKKGGSQSALSWYCKKCDRMFFPRVHKVTTEPSGIINTKAATCIKGHEMWPDYSVMLHLADSMLSLDKCPAESQAKTVLDPGIGFDIDLNAELYDFLHVSRLFDQGRADDGFKLGFNYQFFAGGLSRKREFHSSQVESRLVRELANHASCVSGNTISELAGVRMYKINRTDGVAAKVTPEREETKAQPASQSECETVWVQIVESDGYWVTFDKSRIGKDSFEQDPPSGWCPASLTSNTLVQGDQVNVIFDPALGYRNGFCFVRTADGEDGSDVI